MIFIIGIVPGNDIPRILQFLNGSGRMAFSWIPDPSSVINWIARAGLGALAKICPSVGPWIAIIDTSISYGK